MQEAADALDDFDEEESSVHKPTKNPVACMTLELYRPEKTDGTKAWAELRTASRDIGKAAQVAIADIAVSLRDQRMAGKMRFSTADERAMLKDQEVPLPSECWDTVGFKTAVEKAMKATGLTEYIWSSVTKRIVDSEFAGDRLNALLRGDSSFPLLRNVPFTIRNRNWRVLFEEVTKTDVRTGQPKTYTNVVIETSAWRPGEGKMRLVCKSLHGRGVASMVEVLKKLVAIDYDKSDVPEAEGYAKGALQIARVRRPGQPEKWFVRLPYKSSRLAKEESDSLVIVHRGVVNMLSFLAIDKKNHVTTGSYPGTNLVRLKSQMYARRKLIQKDLSATPHAGRGKKKHFAALKKLSDKEARFTDTELWRAAKAVQVFAERHGASIVLLDNFGAFQSDDPNLAPYVRRFPLAELKGRVIDALTRRAGVKVNEEASAFISQKCPVCSHTCKENIKRLPKVVGYDAKDGFFECVNCQHSGDLELTSIQNMLLSSKVAGEPYKAALIKAISRTDKMISNTKAEMKVARMKKAAPAVVQGEIR
jgi:hypothetical protein